MSNIKFFIDFKSAGQRIDQVLASKWPEQSRAYWQKQISTGAITHDGTIIESPSFRVRGGSEIKYMTTSWQSDNLINIPQLTILYEDDRLIVVDKPAGMLTHAKGDIPLESTVATLLSGKVAQDGTNRAGIIHRLDRLTSGILVVAKDEETRTLMQKQFAQRRVTKLYTAFVAGIVEDKAARFTWPLKRNPKNPSKFITDPAGKPATTEFKVIRQHNKMCEVELKPVTGRTHQLRVHLLKYGHPILGDPLYAPKEIRELAPRLCLHASKIRFVLEGKQYKFMSPLPKALRNIREQNA